MKTFSHRQHIRVSGRDASPPRPGCMRNCIATTYSAMVAFKLVASRGFDLQAPRIAIQWLRPEAENA